MSINPLTKASLNSTLTNVVLDNTTGQSSFLIKTGNQNSLFINSSSQVAIGHVSPSAQLDINSSTGSCLILRYNGTSNTSSLNMDSSGLLSITATGGEVNTTSNLNIKSHNGSTTGLKLNDTLVLASAAQLNYNVVTAGTASAGKTLVLDGTGSITGITSISSTSIVGTITTAAQTNITSLGTLSALSVNGNITATGTLTVDGSTITSTSLSYLSGVVAGTASASKALVVDTNKDITGIHSISSTTFLGTIGTAAQTNITSLGTLTGLTVSGITSFTNTTDSSSSLTGSIIISGGVGIAKNLYVGGNLTVNGTLTTIQSTTVTITDNTLVLNSGPSGTGKDSGVLVNRYQIDNNLGTGDVVGDTPKYSTTILSATINTITLAVGADTNDNYYTNWWIKITSGSINNNVRKVIGYVGSSRTLTLSSDLTGIPLSGATINLYNKAFPSFIWKEDSKQFATTFTVVDSSTSLSITDYAELKINNLLTVSTTSSTTSTVGAIVTSGGIGIANTTDASTTTNGGAMTIAGGVAIAKKLYVGTSIATPAITLSTTQTNAYPIHMTTTADRTVALYNTDSTTGDFYGFGVNNNTLLYHSKTNHKWYIDSIGNTNGTNYLTLSDTTLDLTGTYNSSGGYQIGSTTVINSSKNITNVGTISASGIVSLTNNTASTSSSTGALVITGGLGVGGDVYGAASINSQRVFMKAATNTYGLSHKSSDESVELVTNVSGSDASIGTYTNTKFCIIVNKSKVSNWTSTGLRVGDTTTASYKLDVNGDINTSGTYKIAGTTVIDSSKNITNIGTISASGIVSLTNATSSTSTSTGALVVSGGVGIGGTLYVESSNIGGTSFTSTQAGYLTSITIGTASASKALVLDASSNISGISTLSTTAITLNGTDLTTTLNGINTNISQISGVVGGTVSANKAVVVDANKDISSFRNLTATTLYGTIGTATQTGITSIGTLTSLAVTGANNSVVITNTTTTGTSNIKFTNDNRSYEFGLRGSANTTGEVNGLYIYDNTNDALRMTMDTSGNFGIGVSLPTYLIDVGGSINGLSYYLNGVSIIASALTGVTLGTSTANKVLTTDSSNNISGINSLGATTLVGTLGTAAQTGITSVGTLSSLIVSGITSVTNTTNSTSSITGALVVSGGVGIASNLYVGSGIYGTISTAAQTSITSVGTLTGLTVSGVTSITNTTNSTSSITGALVVSGGVGIASNLYVGSGIYGTISTAAQTSITSVGTLTGLTVSGIASITNTTNSTSISTGALVVSGGVGITNNLYVGSGIYGTISTAAQTSITSVGTLTGLTVSGVTSITNTTNSTSTTTGALVVSGGVGIASKLYVGSGIYGTISTSAQTNITSVGTLTGLSISGSSDMLTLTNTTDSDRSNIKFVCSNTFEVGVRGNTNPILPNCFYIKDNTSTTYRLSINSSGYVGIGLDTIAPSYKLDVGGDINTTTVYKIGGTTVIDSSRNLTNIGTISATTLTATTLNGTISSTNAAQTNITSVGTLTSLNISGSLNQGSTSKLILRDNTTWSSFGTTTDTNIAFIRNNAYIGNWTSTGLRVGDGTNPSYVLDVNGDINTTGSYRVGGTIVNLTALTATAGTVTASKAVIVDSSKNISGFATVKVDTLTSNNGGTAINITNDATSWSILCYDATNNIKTGISTNGWIGTYSNNTLSIATNNTTRMTVGNTGIVSITNTTNSTSTSTGALVVSGGVGIASNLYVGTGIYGTLQTAAQTNITSVGALNGVVLTPSSISVSTYTITNGLWTSGTDRYWGMRQPDTSTLVLGCAGGGTWNDKFFFTHLNSFFSIGERTPKVKFDMGTYTNDYLIALSNATVAGSDYYGFGANSSSLYYYTITDHKFYYGSKDNAKGTLVLTVSSTGVDAIGYKLNGTAYDISLLSATAGTVTASNAVIVDSNKDISGFRTLKSDTIVVNTNASTTNIDSGVIVNRYQIANESGTGDVVSDTATYTTTVTSTTTATIVLAAGASAVDNYYTNWWIKITSGNANNNVRKVTGYIGSTKTLTLATSLSVATTAGDAISLYSKSYPALVWNETNNQFIAAYTPTYPSTSYTIIDKAEFVANDIIVSSTTDATSSSSGGGITIAGGAAVAKKLYVGTSIATPAITLSTTQTNAYPIHMTTAADRTMALYNVDSTNGDFYGFGANNSVLLYHAKANHKWYLGTIGNTTGTNYLTLSSTALDLTGTYNSSGGYQIGSTTVIDSSKNISNVGTISASGIVSITNNTSSTSSSTGALVITGGLGVGGDIYGASFINSQRVLMKAATNTYGLSHRSSDGVVELVTLVSGTDASIGTYSNHKFCILSNNTCVGNWSSTGLRVGDSNTASYKLDVNGDVRIGTTNSTTANKLIFAGTSGDSGPNTTVIAERLYQVTEKSELLLFKGNDPDSTNGPDRIRLRGANVLIQTFNSTEDYSTISDNNTALSVSATGIISLPISTDATSISDGALIVSGGVGISKKLYVGTTLTTANLVATGSVTAGSFTKNTFVLNTGPTATGNDIGLLLSRYQKDNNTGEGDVVSDTAKLSTTVTSTNTTTVVLSSGVAVDDYYKNWWIKITSGPAINNVRQVTGYVGSTKTLTLSTSLSSATVSGNGISLYNKSYPTIFWKESVNEISAAFTVADSTSTLSVIEYADFSANNINSFSSYKIGGTEVISNSGKFTGSDGIDTSNRITMRVDGYGFSIRGAAGGLYNAKEIITWVGDYGCRFGTYSADTLYITTNDVDRIKIASDGRIGFNINAGTNIQHYFTNNSNGNFPVYIDGSRSYTGDNTAYITWINKDFSTLQRSSSNWIGTTGVSLYCTYGIMSRDNVMSYSDRRLKKNIHYFDNDEISKIVNGLRNIKLCSFTWKSDETNTIGVIAQDLIQHGILEPVDIHEDEELKKSCEYDIDGISFSVNYSKFNTMLLPYVQELETKVISLENNVSELKAENEYLKSQIDTILIRLQQLENAE